jgi:hypothetical protein
MPAVDQRTIQVRGLRELSRAFKVADSDIRRDLRAALQSAAEPVRMDAERLAVSEITRIGIPWSRMRVGVTQSSVYVAPNERGRRTRGRRRRPNLAPLLLGRAMEPALDRNRARVIREVEDTLADLARRWEGV